MEVLNWEVCDQMELVVEQQPQLLLAPTDRVHRHGGRRCVQCARCRIAAHHFIGKKGGGQSTLLLKEYQR